MKFNKEPDGIFFFTLCHIVFFGQILFVTYIDDEFIKLNKYNEKIKYQNPNLILNKSIFYFFVFLSFISHLRTAMTNPGIITSKNNMNFIQFYYYIHEPFIQRAKAITEKQSEEGIRKIIFETNNIKFDENENYCLDNDDDFDNDSEIDEMKFEKKSSITEEIKKVIIRNYRLKLTRCINCYVARPVNVHHCNVCHCCILERDHHCPWVNNCIGLWNKKFFILYNLYAILSVIYSFIIFCYYTLYKHFILFYNDTNYIIASLLFIIIGIVYAAFAVILLCEQYTNIKSDCTLIDYNNGILMEQSTFKQQLIIIFGDRFSLKWFLPFYSGGYYNLYHRLYKEKLNKNKYDKNDTKKNKID